MGWSVGLVAPRAPPGSLRFEISNLKFEMGWSVELVAPRALSSCTNGRDLKFEISNLKSEPPWVAF
jgi:hypothetical protein